MEHGVRKVDVLVRGPGSGRETAIRSIAADGHRGRRHQRRHPDPAQRLPPEEAAPGLAGAEGDHRMARYTGPVCRLCRRERIKLFLKGERCYSLKCPVSEAVTDRHAAPTRPASTAATACARARSTWPSCARSRRPAASTALLEKQFRNLYDEANRQPGITGENLLRLLELRLDNVAFRATWGASRAQARQLVRHGHVLVERQAGHDPELPGPPGRRRHAQARVARALRRAPQPRHPRPPDAPVARSRARAAPRSRVTALPEREQIDEPVREQLIVELYSK